MNCGEFNDLLPDCLYREVKTADLQEVMSHQMACSSCRKVWEAARQMRDLYASLPVLSPSSSLLEPIYAELNRSQKTVLAGFVDFCRTFATGLIAGGRLAPALMGVLMVTATYLLATSVNSSHSLASRIVSPLTPAFAPEGGLRDQLFSNPMEAAPGFGVTAQPVARDFAQNLPSLRTVAIDDSPLMDGVLSGLPTRDPADLAQKFEERKRALMESDADALMMRGRRLKAMGRVDLALKDFESIYRFYPEYSYMGDVLVYRAQCYAFQGEVEKAVDSLTDFVKKYPGKAALMQPMIEELKNSVPHAVD